MDSHQLPQWAPRVKQALIQRLYENDAAGLLDEDLVDEVGWALLYRCQSFITANAAVAGSALCPVCETTIGHSSGRDEVLICPKCGWSLPWKDYFSTIQHKQLSGAEEIRAVFREYIERFPKAGTPEEKMLNIDTLIHAFHWNALHTPGARACGVNLIEGKLHEVVQFLNQLTAGSASTPGVVEQREAWRKVINEAADYWKDERLRVRNDE